MSKKKLELNEEDKKLFQDEVKDVKPIKKDKHILPSQNTKIRIHKKLLAKSLNDFRFTGEIILEKISPDEWLTAENCINMIDGSIPRRILKQLKKGQVQIDSRLDLHGYTGDEAIKTLTQYLSECLTRGKRVLLIIHGKSHLPGQHGPILKNVVYQWLKNQPQVLAIQSAQAKHGGNGALYVLLRRQKI